MTDFLDFRLQTPDFSLICPQVVTKKSFHPLWHICDVMVEITTCQSTVRATNQKLSLESLATAVRSMHKLSKTKGLQHILKISGEGKSSLSSQGNSQTETLTVANSDAGFRVACTIGPNRSFSPSNTISLHQ